MGSWSERPVVEPLGLAESDRETAREKELDRDAERELAHWRGRIDLQALLVALVLVPHSYPRNRFFGLFQWPGARDIRRRAALLRSVIADLVGDGEQVAVDDRGSSVVLRYSLREASLHRTTMLARDELALIKLAIERATAGGAPGALVRGREAVLAPLHALVDDQEVDQLLRTLERLFVGGRAR
ncbi:MAG: hypothetical protein DRI90_06695 [Deltaproteobacteria bacterium]|nr:MAG: hypothetical protein DRI90_06695 [Deltaproteobacteria bacterium]